MKRNEKKSTLFEVFFNTNFKISERKAETSENKNKTHVYVKL